MLQQPPGQRRPYPRQPLQPGLPAFAKATARSRYGSLSRGTHSERRRKGPGYLAHSGYSGGNRYAISSPATPPPLTATTMYCTPSSTYVIGEPDCAAGM